LPLQGIDVVGLLTLTYTVAMGPDAAETAPPPAINTISDIGSIPVMGAKVEAQYSAVEKPPSPVDIIAARESLRETEG
jgi:hypothetical protein